MGIAGRGRMAYIDGSNPEPARTSGVWHTWFLEDNQIKTWIVNSVSAEIQPLILRKKTARDMWVVLEQMYGPKKTIIRTYQVMKTVYNLRQGNSSVAEYYGALKAKVFLFLAGLNDEFEGVRSQILNSGEVSSIEDVYSVVEAEEQRRLVTNEGKRDLVLSHERSALVSRGPGGLSRPPRRCTHCKKTGHTVDYCWDLHPDKKGTRGRPSSGKTPVHEAPKSSGEKLSISADQLHELRAYLGRIDVNKIETSEEAKANHALAVIDDKAIRKTYKRREDCLQSFIAAVCDLLVFFVVISPSVFSVPPPKVPCCRLGIHATSRSALSPRDPCVLSPRDLCHLKIHVASGSVPPRDPCHLGSHRLGCAPSPRVCVVALVLLPSPSSVSLVPLTCFPKKKEDMRA
ncbi:hypothetical protein EJ110_NYTH58722 [Nymphaea thermarum]|nr:hypothetical protein EJ110_NYTH58722 [Nymphaea thermarum]